MSLAVFVPNLGAQNMTQTRAPPAAAQGAWSFAQTSALQIKRLSRSNADEEAADELAWLDRHGLVAVGPLDPVALVREPDAGGWTCRPQRLEWLCEACNLQKPFRDRQGTSDQKSELGCCNERETLDASIQHSTPPVQTGSERTYPYKLAARHISGLASYVRRLGYGLDYLFAHARP
jgi:hypothetical protein